MLEGSLRVITIINPSKPSPTSSWSRGCFVVSWRKHHPPGRRFGSPSVCLGGGRLCRPKHQEFRRQGPSARSATHSTHGTMHTQRAMACPNGGGRAPSRAKGCVPTPYSIGLGCDPVFVRELLNETAGDGGGKLAILGFWLA